MECLWSSSDLTVCVIVANTANTDAAEEELTHVSASEWAH